MLLTKDKDDLQLIERFFERELTEHELANFEARLKADHDFAEKVERFGYAHQEVEKIYYPNERETFKKDWDKILDTEEEAPIRKIKPMRYYLMRVAAAILLIFGLTLIVNQFSPSNQSFQQIALQNWEPDPDEMNRVSTRGDTAVVPGAVVWDNAKKTYKAGKFEETLNTLGLLGNKPDALLWKGICHFELEQMPQAISHFDAVIQHKDSGSKDLALWYQALAYLYENNTDDARKNLNIIIENNYPKKRNAMRLLEKL